jgi:hypothetical protein
MLISEMSVRKRKEPRSRFSKLWGQASSPLVSRCETRHDRAPRHVVSGTSLWRTVMMSSATRALDLYSTSHPTAPRSNLQPSQA